MIIRIDVNKPDAHRINSVIECLLGGGIIVYPTDTVYTLGCDIKHKLAFERLCKLKDTTPKNARFTAVTNDFSQIAQFAYSVDNQIFNLLKSVLPGPFTFILHANKKVSKTFNVKRKEIGFRIPDHQIPQAIVSKLGNPIWSASVKNEDKILEYITLPEEIEEVFGNKVDMVIDGGVGGNVPSTVIDCTQDIPELIREGLGQISLK